MSRTVVARAVGVAIAAVGATGCVKAGPDDGVAGAAIPASLLRWAPPPREVAYERKRVIGDIGLPVEPIRQVWNGPVVAGRAALYDVTTGRPDPGARQVVQRMRYGAEGLAIVAEALVTDGQGELEPWVPAMVVLPVEPVVGAKWSADHRHGGESVARSCELLPSDQCAGGIVSVCDRVHFDYRLVVRDHFCPVEGWSGYESLLVREGQPSVRTWTEGLRRVL
jgi:hypothetical protein